MTQDAAQLGLEARASQDVYGSGPQTFPYVSFFQEPWYGGGDGGAEAKTRRTHTFMNLGFGSSYAHEDVYIRGGKLYCGTQEVDVDPAGFCGNGDVYLNVTVWSNGAFTATIGRSATGDLSILLYRITDDDLEDYVSGTMFIPYYN